MHALHWNISSCFRFALCQYSEYHYDYYQFLEGCQSGVVERVTVPDQAAPNLFIYFIVLWPLTQIGSGFWCVFLCLVMYVLDGVCHPL